MAAASPKGFPQRTRLGHQRTAASLLMARLFGGKVVAEFDTQLVEATEQFSGSRGGTAHDW